MVDDQCKLVPMLILDFLTVCLPELRARQRRVVEPTGVMWHLEMQSDVVCLTLLIVVVDTDFAHGQNIVRQFDLWLEVDLTIDLGEQALVVQTCQVVADPRIVIIIGPFFVKSHFGNHSVTFDYLA